MSAVNLMRDGVVLSARDISALVQSLQSSQSTLLSPPVSAAAAALNAAVCTGPHSAPPTSISNSSSLAVLSSSPAIPLSPSYKCDIIGNSPPVGRTKLATAMTFCSPSSITPQWSSDCVIDIPDKAHKSSGVGSQLRGPDVYGWPNKSAIGVNGHIINDFTLPPLHGNHDAVAGSNETYLRHHHRQQHQPSTSACRGSEESNITTRGISWHPRHSGNTSDAAGSSIDSVERKVLPVGYLHSIIGV